MDSTFKTIFEQIGSAIASHAAERKLPVTLSKIEVTVTYAFADGKEGRVRGTFTPVQIPESDEDFNSLTDTARLN